MKFFTRIAALGIAQILVLVAAVLALSGTPMGAEELPTLSAAPQTTEVAPPEAPPTEIALLDAVFDETVFTGNFAGNGPFTINGGALAIPDGVGQRQLVLTDDFQTNRGQELVVFLRSSSGESFRLGELRAVSGAQDFLIPGELNLVTFNEVQIRDVAFDVHYGSAFLSPVTTP